MSKYWDPQEDTARRREAQPKPRWPQGATVGLVLVGGACLGLVVGLYMAAGPRDVFAP